ncbi:hypothetical protein HDU76_003899 [Blyttiomyces sp. JEL0837]|nr:hypothetical protein HDU76_003899 [Blyttiomyces sp. JEL0837]
MPAVELVDDVISRRSLLEFTKEFVIDIGLVSYFNYSSVLIFYEEVASITLKTSFPLSLVVWSLLAYAASQHSQLTDGSCIKFPRLMYFAIEIVTYFVNCQGMAVYHLQGLWKGYQIEKDAKPPDQPPAQRTEPLPKPVSIMFGLTFWIMSVIFIALFNLILVFMSPLMILVQTIMLNNDLIDGAYANGLIWAFFRFFLRASIAPKFVKTVTNKSYDNDSNFSNIFPAIIVEYYNSHVSFYMAFRSMDYLKSFSLIVIINALDVVALLFNAWIYRREEQRKMLASVQDFGWEGEDREQQLPVFSAGSEGAGNDGSLANEVTGLGEANNIYVANDDGEELISSRHTTNPVKSPPTKNTSDPGALLKSMSSIALDTHDQRALSPSTTIAPYPSRTALLKGTHSAIHLDIPTTTFVTKALEKTHELQHRLNPRQLDIEDRVKLSRYVFVSKMTGLASSCIHLVVIDFIVFKNYLDNVNNAGGHDGFLYKSSVGYFDSTQMWHRIIFAIVVTLVTSFFMGLYEERTWASCISAKRKTNWWDWAWRQIAAASIVMLTVNLIVSEIMAGGYWWY